MPSFSRCTAIISEIISRANHLLSAGIPHQGAWACPYSVERLSLYDGHFGFE